MSAKTLFDKIWDEHVVQSYEDGWALLHVDRHMLHEISGSLALSNLKQRELPVRNASLCIATPDHMVSTAPGRTGQTNQAGASKYNLLKDLTAQAKIRMFDLGEPGQGIVHVIGAELGAVQPGMTIVCGDSHTCTNGALGALAFGIGTSEVEHVLASQTIMQRKPKNFCILLTGNPRLGVTAKDIALFLVGRIGASGGIGYAFEFVGPVISSMSIEERMTLCNMSIEMGAKVGIVAPDEKTIDYLKGRPFSSKASLNEEAVAYWGTLKSDFGALFHRTVGVDVSEITPMITWGTSPEHVMRISGQVPHPGECTNLDTQRAWEEALKYMGLHGGQNIRDVSVDRVFIGSCTNSRISDLREAAALIQGRKVASHVQAWVVPGSENVKREAEFEGLDSLFKNAGFEWRESGCSMCVGINGDLGSSGQRIVSTSNRNFVGRQGPGVRTHLASPATAVATAIAGMISSV